jgi:putative ABC transport system substrate-binding protein
MNRRETLLSLLALAAATPRGARAQTPARKLGILASDPPPAAGSVAFPPFRAKLKQLGWLEGQNLEIAGAYADRKSERLASLAEELVRQRVDVIWAVGSEPAVAAARATAVIPIVFWGVAWPVEQGLIESFAKPGRNVTGVSGYTGIEVSAKRLEFLRDIAPAARRLSWILAPDNASTVQGGTYEVKPFLEKVANKLGFEVRWHFVRKEEDLEAVFAEVLAFRAQALSIASSVVTYFARQRIAEFALRNRLPSASVFTPFAEAGILLTYSAQDSLSTLFEKSAEYVDRVLRGTRPADLPVDRPSRYELVINVKTAQALGLAIPPTLRLRADRMIE